MKEVPCPKCGVRMDFMAETESNGNKKEIKYYYRCPACGTKVSASVIEITKKNNNIVIRILQ